MQATVDSVGRIVIPKQLRDALGLRAGTKVDVSFYGAGLQVIPHGRGARLVEKNGRLVISGEGRITNEDVLRLIDEGRR